MPMRLAASIYHAARSKIACPGLSVRYDGATLLHPPRGFRDAVATNTSVRCMASLRRKRKKYEKFDILQVGNQLVQTSTGLENPFEYSGDSLEEYSEKATLSPWTPVPDSLARRIFDLAEPAPDDVHVELGSGDGRVNFFAIEAGVSRSIGIDVDEDIVEVANKRLDRIHPKPNLEFIVADLMHPNHPAWDYVKGATILTMYFAREGLEKIRPLLENALRGKRCRIYCCGYAMPGWDYQMVETVLDMPIHFYDWGNSEVEDTLLDDRFIENIPIDNIKSKTMDRFHNKKNSTFRADPLKGFHPDDLIDYGWDDFKAKPEGDKK